VFFFENSHEWVDQQKQWQWRDLIPVVKVEVIAVCSQRATIQYVITTVVWNNEAV